jgi:hypothetical protein
MYWNSRSSCLSELGDGTCEHVADDNGSIELDNIVTPDRATYEDIDDVLRSFIDLAAQHKRTWTYTGEYMAYLIRVAHVRR